jgi:hypothetical protein
VLQSASGSTACRGKRHDPYVSVIKILALIESEPCPAPALRLLELD